MESNITIIDRLQGVIANCLSDLFDPSERFALLDFPNHYNIGDSAIWLGELAYFDRKRTRPTYVTEIPTYDEGRMLNSIRPSSCPTRQACPCPCCSTARAMSSSCTCQSPVAR